MFVAQNGVFLESEFISKGTSGNKVQLEEVREPQDNIELPVDTHTQQTIVDTPPIAQNLCRFDRIRQEPERYGFLVTDNHDVLLVDQNEPATYQEAMLDPDSEKWLEAMKSEIQSMYDNQLWTLIDPPEGTKTIGCKWVFKKKTDMDGKVHTYKARLVAKGFKQTHGIDYDETFSPIAMLKCIRILISIAAYHDYEIWKMDVKTVFLNGNLLEDVYMTQPEGFEQSAYIDKVLKRFSMQDSKRGYLPMSHGITLRKSQCPNTKDEREWMSKIPYASAIGSILYAMLCTRQMYLML